MDESGKGVSLQWSDVKYTLTKAGPKNKATKTRDDKVVLQGVSGYAKPGTLTAILGASGAGKTSLVRVILRLHPPQPLSAHHITHTHDAHTS